MKRNKPKVIHATARNISAGLNRLLGQAKLMNLYATFDTQTEKEKIQVRKTGAHRMSKAQTRRRQIVPTEPRGFGKSTNLAPASGRADIIPSRAERLGAGNISMTEWNIAGQSFFVNETGMPA